jgi:anaerobic ribonucleoside-triphosphate reductase
MTVTTVTKRAGHAVPYDRAKIRNAIAAASKEYVHPMTGIEIDEVTSGG